MGGRLGELVDVRTGSRTGGPRRNRGHDLRVRHRRQARHRGHDRNRRLAATRDHVQIGGIEVLLEVHDRHNERAKRSRGQIDQALSIWSKGVRVVLMARGRGGVKHDFNLIELRHLDKAGHAVGRRRYAHALCAGEPVRLGINANQRADLEFGRTSQDLEHQVGPDVS